MSLGSKQSHEEQRTQSRERTPTRVPDGAGGVALLTLPGTGSAPVRRAPLRRRVQARWRCVAGALLHTGTQRLAGDPPASRKVRLQPRLHHPASAGGGPPRLCPALTLLPPRALGALVGGSRPLTSQPASSWHCTCTLPAPALQPALSPRTPGCVNGKWQQNSGSGRQACSLLVGCPCSPALWADSSSAPMRMPPARSPAPLLVCSSLTGYLVILSTESPEEQV